MAKKKKLNFLEQMEAEGKVLCAKAGKEREFLQALENCATIGKGKLGWQGQAEMFCAIGMDEIIAKDANIKLPKDEKKRVKKIRQILINTYVGGIMDYAEWVTEAEAESRAIYNKVLYDQLEKEAKGEQKRD
jgi:hypothetical protein